MPISGAFESPRISQLLLESFAQCHGACSAAAMHVHAPHAHDSMYMSQCLAIAHSACAHRHRFADRGSISRIPIRASARDAPWNGYGQFVRNSVDFETESKCVTRSTMNLRSVALDSRVETANEFARKRDCCEITLCRSFPHRHRRSRSTPTTTPPSARASSGSSSDRWACQKQLSPLERHPRIMTMKRKRFRSRQPRSPLPATSNSELCHRRCTATNLSQARANGAAHPQVMNESSIGDAQSHLIGFM